MRLAVIGAVGISVLAGCVAEVPPEPVENACGAAELQVLVGQPAAVLQTMKFGTQTRIIRPGMAVTMDYRPDRLNIDIDHSEQITRVYCT